MKAAQSILILVVITLGSAACHPERVSKLPLILAAEQRLASTYFSGSADSADRALKTYITETDALLSQRLSKEEIQTLRTGRSLAFARLAYIKSSQSPDLSVAIREMKHAGDIYLTTDDRSLESAIISMVSEDKVPWLKN